MKNMLKYQLGQLNNRQIGVIDNINIDVHDLPEEEIKFIQKIIDLFREREKIKKEKVEEKIKFASWPLEVKDKLSRNEI